MSHVHAIHNDAWGRPCKGGRDVEYYHSGCNAFTCLKPWTLSKLTSPSSYKPRRQSHTMLTQQHMVWLIWSELSGRTG